MDYENEGLLHEMLIRQAEATPDKIAIVEPGGKQLTFRDLHGDSDVLAKTLKRIGVQSDSCVGIYLDKSIEFSVTYIAILKAGIVYNGMKNKIIMHANISCFSFSEFLTWFNLIN